MVAYSGRSVVVAYSIGSLVVTVRLFGHVYSGLRILGVCLGRLAW